MAEIFCKRCFHHEELGRPVKPGEPCPSCAAPGVFRRVKRVGPATHLPSVSRAIFSLRGVFSLAAFALVGTVPIGALAAASILLLYLGGLRLALKGQIGILAAFWTAGHAVAYFALCLLPLVTLTTTLTHLRNLARHVQLWGVGDPEPSRCRTIHARLIERFFFAPMNIQPSRPA